MDGVSGERELASSDYWRDLGDGLILRWSTGADTERLVALIGTVFRRRENQPPNERMMRWTRDMMSGRHPLIGQDGFALVEDTATGAIVAGACLLSEAWDYEGIRIPAGRPEVVATLPEYRRRGLVRAIFELLHARSAELGQLAQVITGIPWYYRQFGYAYTVDLQAGNSVAAQDIPTAPPDTVEPFTVRGPTLEDIPALARLYDQERASVMVSTPIDEAYWRWMVAGADPRGDSADRVVVIVDKQGSIAGYALTTPGLWGDTLGVKAIWLKVGMWLSGLPAVLRGLKRVGDGMTPERGGEPPFKRLAFFLPAAHPAQETLRAIAPVRPMPDDGYAWYVRVADLPAFLRLVAPALERRLAESPHAGYTGELTFDLYRGGVRLVFDGGRLAEVTPWAAPLWGNAMAGMPPDVFPQLLFGYRDLRELRYAFPDVWMEGAARVLLPVLFPKRESWALPLG